MLMGLPEDYWEQEFIDMVLGPFARAVSWDNDMDQSPTFLCFLIHHDGQSWTVQIEISQHENLVVGPPEEEVVLPMPDDHGPPF